MQNKIFWICITGFVLAHNSITYILWPFATIVEYIKQKVVDYTNA